MSIVVPSTGDPWTDPLFQYRSGSTEPWTVDVVVAMAVALQPYTVIETGTFEGLTTRRLCQALPSATVYSIEFDEQRFLKVKDELADCPNLALSNNDALEAMRGFADESVDFIFLDDDHVANHVAEEIIEARRILRSGGVCVVHDVHGHFGLDAIVKLAGGVNLPFVKLHRAGGLGVIVR